MNKKNIIFVVILIFAIIWGIISIYNNYSQNNSVKNDNKTEVKSDKIVVVSSLFPWYDLARQIGGDYVEVTLLLPPGVEAHSFEPRPNDMITISQAGLFVYTGDYLEPWASDLINSLGNDAPESIALGEGLAQLDMAADAEHEHEHEEADADHEEHMHSGLDPHIWTDPIIYSQVAGRLAAELAKLDPSHIDYYNDRLDAYRLVLENLDSDYSKTLDTCQQTEFIYAGHYAFGYLAKRYGLQYEAAQGFSPDAESNPQRLKELTDLLTTYQADYIFAEELDNPQLAEALASEAGVKILLLNSAHNVSKDDMRAGVTYENIMRDNLAQLKLGLKCQ